MENGPDEMVRAAMAAFAAGRQAEAGALCEAVLAAGEHPVALHVLALVRANAGGLGDAIALLRRSLAVRPENPDALGHLAAMLGQAGEAEAALEVYDRALALAPGAPDVLSNRGALLRDLRRFEAALADLDAAVAVAPGMVAARANRALVLQALGRHEEALAAAEGALSLQPGLAAMRSLRGMALADLDRLEEASVALAAAPADPPTLNRLAVVLMRLERWEEAQVALRRALTRDPEMAEARVNLAQWNLIQGRYAAGWPLYEARLGMVRRTAGLAEWRGEAPLAGRTLLITAEQGFGDAIQFCRFARVLAERGERVVLQADAPLMALFAGLGVPLAAREGEVPGHDVACPLMSLPMVLGTTLENVPLAGGYLRTDPARVTAWAARLGPKTGLRVGIAWAGNPDYPGDAQRSVRLDQVRAGLPEGAEYVCLQRDIADRDAGALFAGLRVPGREIGDFADTAAIMALCDVVVSTCTSIAHLAGALGRPGYVLLQRVPGWRWGLEGEVCPWYRSLTLIRQSSRGDWDGVFARLRGVLSARL